MAAPLATVLCIDDSDIGLALLSDLLAINGYSVLTADSGAEGLKLIANQHVDAGGSRLPHARDGRARSCDCHS